MERWVRLLDKKREDDTRRDPNMRWRERLRVVPENQKDTELLALPQGMPIDYFDPPFFNNLQPRLRQCVTNGQVALLPNVDLSFTGIPDEKISDEKFMDKYAMSVLKQYNLVGKGELDGADEDEWMIDGDDRDDGDEDEGWGDEDMADKRQELADRLSVTMV